MLASLVLLLAMFQGTQLRGVVSNNGTNYDGSILWQDNFETGTDGEIRWFFPDWCATGQG